MNFVQRFGHADEVDGADLLVEGGHESHLQIQELVQRGGDLFGHRVVRLDQIFHGVLYRQE